MRFINYLRTFLIIGFCLLTFLFVLDERIFAEETNHFVTIVNPVRISSYNISPLKSLDAEYRVIREFDLPSTWLITYDVLENPEMVLYLKNMDKKHEIGLFLEVSKNFSEKAEVKYNDTGYWHHATSVFLSGYVQKDRIKLIDTVFEKFKKEFGYYPSSVGSWWTDSYSLSYMQNKYGIKTDLGCSDQYSTDGYQIWGQFFNFPFYPSKNHAGIPGKTDKLDVLKVLWAFRDPLNGYKSSMYSTQDYTLTKDNLDIEYFKRMVDFYLFENNNKISQITVGLEADLFPEVYKNNFKKEIEYIKQLQSKNQIEVLKLQEFSELFRGYFGNGNPIVDYRADDFLGSGIKAIWFQNDRYRLFYEEDNKGNKTIKDLRIYDDLISEPYYLIPNREFNLYINIPAVVDYQSNNKSLIELGQAKILTKEDEVIITDLSKLPEWFMKSPYLDVKKIKKGYSIKFVNFDNFKINNSGKEVKNYSLEALHFFRQKSFPLSLLKGKGWEYFKKVDYFIPQEEIWALYFLKMQDGKKVLVYDKECLQCEYEGLLKPQFFSNSRNYIEKISGKKVIKNNKIFLSENINDSYNLLRRLKIDYIYLVKFMNYKETVPYSPGDLGIEKIFENANAELWRVK